MRGAARRSPSSRGLLIGRFAGSGEAAGLGLRVIDVDVTMTEDDLAGQVARAFGL